MERGKFTHLLSYRICSTYTVWNTFAYNGTPRDTTKTCTGLYTECVFVQQMNGCFLNSGDDIKDDEIRVERVCDFRLSYEVIVSKPSRDRDVSGRNSEVDRRETARNRLVWIQLTRGDTVRWLSFI